MASPYKRGGKGGRRLKAIPEMTEQVIPGTDQSVPSPEEDISEPDAEILSMFVESLEGGRNQQLLKKLASLVAAALSPDEKDTGLAELDEELKAQTGNIAATAMNFAKQNVELVEQISKLSDLVVGQGRKLAGDYEELTELGRKLTERGEELMKRVRESIDTAEGGCSCKVPCSSSKKA